MDMAFIRRPWLAIALACAFVIGSPVMMRAQMTGVFNHALLQAPSGTSCNDAIVAAGATAGLVYSWDISDSGAYGGTGQTITDQSGSGNNWYFGTGSGAGADDPTFNGSAGSKSSSTYLSYDGGDVNTIAVANPTAINSMSKDNAKFVLLLAIKTPATFAAEGGLFGTNAGASGNVGVIYYLTSAAKQRYYVTDGAGGNPLIVITDGTVATSTTMMVAVSIDEAAATGFFWQNGNYMQVGASNTFNATYSSPSASNATFAAQLLAWGNSTLPIGNGAFAYCAALWSGTIPSKATLDTIYTLSKPRLGLP